MSCVDEFGWGVCEQGSLWVVVNREVFEFV